MNRVVGDGVDPVVTLLTSGCGQLWGREQTPALSLTLPGQPHTPPFHRASRSSKVCADEARWGRASSFLRLKNSVLFKVTARGVESEKELCPSLCRNPRCVYSCGHLQPQGLVV